MLTKLYFLGQTNEKGFNLIGHAGPILCSICS